MSPGSRPGSGWYRLSVAAILGCVAQLGCGKKVESLDQPRLGSRVVMRDIAFRSAALGREMHYRAVLPASATQHRKLPVLYLLHGNGGSLRDWTNFSDVSQFAEAGLILVMPEGDNSYYVNAALRPGDRYEDYVIQDLIPDVERRFPASPNRKLRAIAGVSMGGYGAIKIAWDHPDLFSFAGALSPAVDAPRRRFSVRRIPQYLAFRSIFGPWGSEARRRSDLFLLARSVDAASAPSLYLTCGEAESLLGPNRRFVAVLAQHHLPYEFHAVPGAHDWKQWNQQLPGLFQRLMERLGDSGP